MGDAAMRVALLARPGAACDNLQAALHQAGADVVLVADPTNSDAGSLAASSPQAVLVALEPAVEDALDRYDEILLDPATIVIYDEVAVAARREGWDAARWSRHLAAKLGRHHDVLPPGGETLSESVPTTPPVPLVQRIAPATEPVPQAAPEPAVAPEALSLAPEFDDQIHLGGDIDGSDQLAESGSDIDFGGLSDEMTAMLAVDSADQSGHVLEWESASIAPAPVAEPTLDVEAPAPVHFSLDEMTLVDTEPSPAASVEDYSAPDAPATLSIPGAEGAVVVLAGIGGPDAVRHFLAALPVGFAKPIVVRQRLDGGRHDRLVRQMQRATSLPVELAEAGGNLIDGHVYILPDGMATTQGAGVATFVVADGLVPVLAGLPPGDSAILVLSGSDPASVPEVLAAAQAGALVATQLPEECFDGAAPTALIAAGVESGAPADLGKRLTRRWLSLKD